MAGSYKTARVMMNKADAGSIRVIEELPPRDDEAGCWSCCAPPPACACCLVLPCCTLPKSMKAQLADSRYIFVKETSIEWNDPSAVGREGGCCCGIDPFEYRLQDDVTVLYYDDPLLNDITDETRCCNDCRTYCFGGRGDEIQMRNTFCLGTCAKGLPPCCMVPSFCPRSLCPCVLRYTLYVKRGQGPHALQMLTKARNEARTAATRIKQQLER